MPSASWLLMLHGWLPRLLSEDLHGYHPLSAGSSSKQREQAQEVLTVAFIILFALGSHFCKNALAPAEPALEAIGMTPLTYAMVTALPAFASVVFPIFWGMAYKARSRLVLLLVPIGMLFGQSVVACGLATGIRNIPEGMFVAGWATVSVFRSGVDVIQHTFLANKLQDRRASGFAGLVFCTHFVNILCNECVPSTIGAGGFEGVLRVQLLLMVPGLVSLMAAMALAFALPCKPMAHTDTIHVQTVGMHEKLSETSSCRSKEVLYCRPSFLPASWLLVGWGAFMVGLLKAVASVTNALTVDLGLSAEAGGKTNATNQMVALTLLPLVGIFGDKVRASSAVLVVSSTAIAFVCSLLLILSQIIALPFLLWNSALLGLSIAGTLVPVLVLALLPEVVAETGVAYGALESLKGLSETPAHVVSRWFETVWRLSGCNVLLLRVPVCQCNNSALASQQHVHCNKPQARLAIVAFLV
mmetsp:Transcript_623/g.1144  ORF Transcript_623/g.1144 Transcript_623/m.1144 type:complete len:471 (+) Transcript_623:54-1466(+)